MRFVQRIQRNPLTLLFLGMALILAAIALVWVNVSTRHAGSREASAPAHASPERISTATILFAKQEIRRGSVVRSDDLQLREVAAPAPLGSFTDAPPVIGRVATSDILPGQIVLSGALSEEKVAAGVAALVATGERAFSVRVGEDQIVGGFLRVNDRVDVFVTLPGALRAQSADPAHGEGDQSKSALLLQNIAVLAVGEKLVTSGPDALNGVRTVTLAVTPNAVARLALADRLGRIALAIRNPSDREVAPQGLVGLSDLDSTSPDLRAVAASTVKKEGAASPGHRITIYSGATTTSVTTDR